MNILMTLANPFTHDPRVYNEAKSLVDAGHKVTVLAWDKTGKHSKKEIKDGIQIVRSYNSKFMNILPYDIFRLHVWWRKGYKDTLKLFKENSFDAVHCHDLSSLPIGAKLKKKLGLPLIYDAHEIWGYMVAKDLPKIWVNYYLWKEKKLVRLVDKIITAENKYSEYFESITDLETTPVLNCKHLISDKYIPPRNTVFTLLYIGTLAPPRFLWELTDVVKKIDDVRCFIGGGGKPEYVEKLKQKCNKTDNVKFIGEIPFDEVISTTQNSDVVVCMIDPANYNNQIATANKQFEAMVCGKPIICTNRTRSGEITKQEQCGLVVDYSKKSLGNAIIKLRDSPKLCEELGKNALKAAINKYNWEIEEKKLLELYERIKVTR